MYADENGRLLFTSGVILSVNFTKVDFMDVTTKAIALKSTDFNENDKFVLLYSLQYGKISVRAKGVRKSSAKLKYAADQFCFGQYELSKTDDRFTLKTCEQLESFYSLRESVEGYYSACVVAECLANYTQEGQCDAGLFIETLRALQSLTDGAEPLLTALRFVTSFLRISGFALDFSKGGVVCADCRTADSLLINAGTVSALRMVDGLDYLKLRNVNVPNAILKDALSVVNKYLSYVFSPNKSLSELLKIT